MPGSHNLAARSDAERLAVAVDLITKRLLHYKTDKGKVWRQWAGQEIAKLTPRYQQPVRDRLNCLCGVKAK